MRKQKIKERKRKTRERKKKQPLLELPLLRYLKKVYLLQFHFGVKYFSRKASFSPNTLQLFASKACQ